MSATPTPGAPERAAVRSMFDRIAPRYDLLNRILSAGVDARWRRQAVDLLAPAPAARVLDLCTGTADLLIEALRRDEAASGIGVDVSLGMMASGVAKLARLGCADRARLVAGDAEALPLHGAVFDAAVVGFGIRNVGNPAGALRELHRVLRPGGRLVVLEFSMPRGAIGALYRLYFRQLLPWVAGLWSERSAYAYLPASVARFPSPQGFGALMESAGFTGVRWRLLTAGIACLHRGERS